MTPVLKVKNVNESIKFYEKLNFNTVLAVPDSINSEFAIINNGEVELMLQEETSIDAEYSLMKGKVPGGTFTLYMDLGNI